MTTAFEISMSPAVDAPPSDGAAGDLYWLPLGAGGRGVRFNGLVFEAIAARLQHRTRSDLYHSALEVRVGSHRYVIEMAPVWNEHASDRGVVSEGAVASPRLARLRLFRYEIRRWHDGRIPDIAEAVDSPQRLTEDPAVAQRVLDLVPSVPALVRPRGIAQRRHVELQLRDRVACRSSRDRRGTRRPPSGRARPRLDRRNRRDTHGGRSGPRRQAIARAQHATHRPGRRRPASQAHRTLPLRSDRPCSAVSYWLRRGPRRADRRAGTAQRWISQKRSATSPGLCTFGGASPRQSGGVVLAVQPLGRPLSFVDLWPGPRARCREEPVCPCPRPRAPTEAHSLHRGTRAHASSRASPVCCGSSPSSPASRRCCCTSRCSTTRTSSSAPAAATPASTSARPWSCC